MNDYDVIVIGSGARGGTLAHHLAPSGKRILLLERGDWLPREPHNWRAQDVFVDGRYISPDTWYYANGEPFQPQVHYFVGGATKLYGAALYRLRREDFGEDPTEPPASAPYPQPPVAHEPRIQQLSDDLAAAGLHPFHAPCGVRLDADAMPFSPCVRCDNCDGFPCLVHGNSDAEVVAVRPAIQHSNVTLLTGAEAVRLECNSAGTAVTGVVVERNGDTDTFRGDIVVSSCGAANSARLLLASACEAHPHGLANGL